MSRLLRVKVRDSTWLVDDRVLLAGHYHEIRDAFWESAGELH